MKYFLAVLFVLFAIGLLSSSLEKEKQAKCRGYFQRMLVNHESASEIIPEKLQKFCLEYSKEPGVYRSENI